MGTGWRRAFCTTIPRDGGEATNISDKQQTSPSPSPGPRTTTSAKLGFFSSNPSTPRLSSQRSLPCRKTTNVTSPPPPETPPPQQQQQQPLMNETPKLKCKTSTPKSIKSLYSSSTPSSPRSPLKLSLFRNSFRLRNQQNTCGVCMQSVKTGQGMAIYTAECAHAFHFPCIAAHVRKQGSLVCPVCNSTWKDVPLLAAHKNLPPPPSPPPPPQNQLDDVVREEKIRTPKKEVKKRESSPRQQYYHHHDQHHQTKFSDVRTYDDDERLLSPTASGGKFVAIPEANEGDEEDEGAGNDEVEEEFQGFFVNPTRSCSIKSDGYGLIDGVDSRHVEVRLMPEAAIVSTSPTHETYAVALRVKAPRPPPSQPARNSNNAPLLDPSRRAPIDLITVLDVSGSMTGAKLQMLKRAMRLVISSLGSADRLSIVAFSACPKRLLPLKRMTVQGQRSARRIIDRLVCGGQGTSVGDALRKATKILEDRRERNPVASVILLSDGHDEQVQPNANHNQRPATTAQVSSTRFAHVEIPVHSFGYGKSGGYTHEPAEDAFAKCVGGLLSVVVQDLHIQLGFASGSAPAEISAVYCCNGRPTVLSSGIVRLGDLYAEEERELLVEMRVPTSAVGSHHVMSVRCSYKDPATQEVFYDREQTLIVPGPYGPRSSSLKIERLRYLFIATRAIAESRRLVEHNGFSSAHHMLSSARALLMQSSSVSADEYVRGLEAEIVELAWRRQQQLEQEQMMIQRRKTSEREREMTMVDEDGEPLTPTSAWRAAEQLAKMAIMKKSMNRVSDLHGFENARF